MGLIVGVALAALVWIIVWKTRRVGGAALQLLGAALLVGLAGYALQGRAGLTGSPAAERATRALPPAMAIPLAEEFFGRFNGAYSWLVIANSFLARGDSGEAVATLASATHAAPGNAQLWIAYANAIRLHSGGRISPAARLAFERAAELAPDHPGPAFFFGLAVLQSGDVEGARAVWNDLLAKAPAGAPWGRALAVRIAILRELQARTILRPGAPPSAAANGLPPVTSRTNGRSR